MYRMEFMKMLSGHWVELIVAVYLIGMTLYGHYKGFIRLAVSALSIVITLAAVHIASPAVTNWIKNDTPVYGAVKESMGEAIGLDALAEKLEGGESMGKADERVLIEKFELPAQMKKLLIENNNGEIYRLMGVERFQDYVCSYLADMIIRAAVFVVMFFAVFILLHVAVIWLDLLAKLPILSGLNQIAGAILGGAEGLFFFWVVCLVVVIFSGTSAGAGIMSEVNASPWLSWLFNHNLLSRMALGLVKVLQ